MKPPYSGNKCLKGLSSIKEAKSMPGFKASKDRTTVLLGGNVAGYKLKHFVIGHRENLCFQACQAAQATNVLQEQ